MSIETAPDRALALAQRLEELLQGLGVAARGAPHDPAAAMIGDVGQVALPATVGQLVAADRNQTGQPPLIEVIGHHPLHDPADVSQAMRSSACTWPLAICCAPTATRSSKSRVCRASAGAHGTASTRTPQSRHSTRRSS